MLQHLIIFSLQHNILLLFILKIIVYKRAVQCKVSLLIKSFVCTSVIRLGDVSWSTAYAFPSPSLKRKKYCFKYHYC
jgi:hypothetical protein